MNLIALIIHIRLKLTIVGIHDEGYDNQKSFRTAVIKLLFLF
jgi:hypothetical protein